MKVQQVVKELEDAARALGVVVRRERGSFRGGYCTRDGEELLMLNKVHPPEVHLAILAEALRDLPVDSVFIRPAARRALEDAWVRHENVDLDDQDDG
jgi:hypothetical protein